MGKHNGLQPIKLYMHGPSPNPWKVAIFLEELGIPWTAEHVSSAQLKEPPFTLLNPNGRTPAMVDPNNGITLWEVGFFAQDPSASPCCPGSVIHSG